MDLNTWVQALWTISRLDQVDHLFNLGVLYLVGAWTKKKGIVSGG